MVHLDKLKETYEEKGLTVLAITDEPRARVDKFVEETSAKHTIVIESSDSMRNYGRTSFPSGILVDPLGRILWVGNPGSLADSTISEALDAARILPAFPNALASARKSFDKDKFGDALGKVEKALAGSTLAEEERPAAEGIRDWLVWFAGSSVENAAKDLENGKVYEAWAAYELVAKGFKGREEAKRAAALAKDLLSDKTRKREVDAGRKLAKIKPTLPELSAKKAIKALTPLTSRKYADTKAGQAAAALIAALEKD